MQMIYILTLVS